MTNEKLVSLFQETKNNKLIEQIIKQNRKLVYYVMKRYAVDEVDKEDLFQEGSIGLLKAVDKYDISIDCKFSTYAIWHIRAYMRRYLDKRIAPYQDVGSLNEPMGEEQQSELQDFIKDDLDIEELIKDKLYNKELQEVIQANLSDLEQQAIHLYYYLDLNAVQVAQVLKIDNKDKAYRLMQNALARLRRTSWYAREEKEIRERQIDDRTKWIKAQQYDSIGNSNSHRSFYSSVEDLVLERERIRMSM